MGDIGTVITAAALALTGLGWAAYFAVGSVFVGASALLEHVRERSNRAQQAPDRTTWKD